MTLLRFKTLSPDSWLNDDCMDFYMTLLQRRSLHLDYKGFRCHLFSVFLYSQLMSDKRNVYDVPFVSSWTDNLKSSIFQMDRVLFPINIQNKHWSLIVVYMKERKIEYLDLLGYPSDEHMGNVAHYLDDHAKDQSLESPDAIHWERVVPTNIPKQKDSFNCGIFALTYADYRCLGDDLPFSVEDMPRLRKKVAQEILIG